MCRVSQGDYLQSTDLNSAPERFEWHSRYLALCKTIGVGPAELLDFYEKFIADLPEPERSTTFRQFLGEGRHLSRGTAELLPILGVLTHPHQIPPLINHPSHEVESFLKQQMAQAKFDAIDSIAAVYCLERPEIFELMAAHYPGVLVSSVQRIHDVRKLIEAFAAASPRSVRDELERLHDKLLSILTGIWQGLTAKALHVRQRQLATQADFGSFALLQSWANEHSTVVADWLNGLQPTVQPTTPRRARQPR